MLSVRVGVSGVLCHLDLLTDTTRHDDDWWLCSVLSSGLIDGCFGLNLRVIYPVLICLLDVKYIPFSHEESLQHSMMQ